MKKIYFLLLLTLLGCSYYSCKKDTSSNNSPSNNFKAVIGEWKVDYRIFESYASGKLLDTYTENYKPGSQDYAIFNEDGTGVFKKSGEVFAKFNYTISTNSIDFSQGSYLNSKNNWYKVSDFKYTIIKSSPNELYYSTEGIVAAPSFYDRYITRIHMVR